MQTLMRVCGSNDTSDWLSALHMREREILRYRWILEEFKISEGKSFSVEMRSDEELLRCTNVEKKKPLNGKLRRDRGGGSACFIYVDTAVTQEWSPDLGQRGSLSLCQNPLGR